MTDANADGGAGAGTGVIVVSAVLSFLIVTPVGGLLMDLNWTQAVLIGGFSAVISATAATITGRRAGE